MKDLKKSLKNVAGDLVKAAKAIEKVADQLDAQEKPAIKAVKKTAAKKVLKQAAKQPTAADAVFSIIKRYKKAVNIPTIKKKTGYDEKKIHNIVYKLKKQGKIKSEQKGVYLKA